MGNLQIEPSKLKIAPSLLAADFGNLAGELQRLETGRADWAHLDVMDGHFVPNITFGAPVVARIRERTTLPLDTHLMILNPEKHLADFVQAGSDLITVHAEVCLHLHRVLDQIRELGAKAGVALNPHTPLAQIAHILDLVDLILLMTVNPGFGGQSFIPQVVPKINELHRLLAAENLADRIEIQVDGGITPATAPAVKAAGATVLVAGTAVFGAPDIGRAIMALR